MNVTDRIPLRIANTLLNSLKGGVVPRTGLGYITVGRKDEIDALLNDIEMISEGGASFRFVVGKYGAGKSFLLQTIRNYAMERGFVVMDADLSPERRLVGNKGDGLATYKELMKNLSTQTSPDGGALSLLLSKWINALKTEVMTENSLTADSEKLNGLVEIKIHQTVNELETIVHGFDFARIISLYWKAVVTEDEELKSRTLKWLRGEYGTKTEAKAELGVGVIINDDDWYEYIKLFSMFVVKAGYKGMIMMIDELVNLFKIPNSISRLESSRFSDGSTRDLLSPIIRLKPLTPEEMYFLICKLEKIHAQVYKYEAGLSSETLQYFIKTEFSRVGAGQNITPREIIRDFIEILNILLQNPDKTLEGILGGDDFNYAKSSEDTEEIRSEFKGFEI